VQLKGLDLSPTDNM